MSLRVTSGCNFCLKGDFSVVVACSELIQNRQIKILHLEAAMYVFFTGNKASGDNLAPN